MTDFQLFYHSLLAAEISGCSGVKWYWQRNILRHCCQQLRCHSKNITKQGSSTPVVWVSTWTEWIYCSRSRGGPEKLAGGWSTSLWEQADRTGVIQPREESRETLLWPFFKEEYKNNRDRLFSRACCNRTRGHSFKWKESWCRLGVRRKFFTMRGGRCPFLQTFKARLPWVTWSSRKCSAHGRGIGLDNHQRSLFDSGLLSLPGRRQLMDKGKGPKCSHKGQPQEDLGLVVVNRDLGEQGWGTGGSGSGSGKGGQRKKDSRHHYL